MATIPSPSDNLLIPAASLTAYIKARLGSLSGKAVKLSRS